MPRIPLYTSQARMTGARTVMPPAGAGTQVAEAVGGLARIVGKGVEDWATKKAQVEAQSEYANNTVLYKQAIGNNIKVQSEDASIDPDDLVSNYKKSMQEVSGSLVWKSKLAQKQFELNKGNFDLAAEQKLNAIGRQRFITNLDAAWKTSRKIAIDSGDLKGGLLALQAIESRFTPAQYKAEKIDLIHDHSYRQAQDALTLDLRADLSGKEYKSLSVKEKADLITEATRIKHNKQIIIDRETKEKQLKNENELIIRSDTEVIPKEELKAMLGNGDIGRNIYFLMLKPANTKKPETDYSVFMKHFNEITEPSGEQKDENELQAAIYKSQMVDKKLTVGDRKVLIALISKPPEKGINYTQMGIKFINDTKLTRVKKDMIIFKLINDIHKGKIEDKQIYDTAVDLTAVVAGREADTIFSTIASAIEKERGKVVKAKKRVGEAFKIGGVEEKRETVFNPEGTGYDMETAVEAGMKPKRGHWGSLDARTGMVLKGKANKKEWDLMVEEETKEGNTITKGADGRYYSAPKGMETFRVREIKTGMTGTIPITEFDAKLYERL